MRPPLPQWLWSRHGFPLLPSAPHTAACSHPFSLCLWGRPDPATVSQMHDVDVAEAPIIYVANSQPLYNHWWQGYRPQQDVLALLLLNTLVWLAWQIQPKSLMWRHFTNSLQNLRARPYTLLASKFSHSSLYHMLSNMVGLTIYAPALQRLLGRQQFMLLYLACGVAGTLGDLLVLRILMPPSAARSARSSLGASGAVYGLMAARAVLAKSSSRVKFLGTKNSPVSLIWKRILLEMVAPHEGIAVWAHASGAAFGAVAAACLKRFGSVYALWPQPKVADGQDDSDSGSDDEPLIRRPYLEADWISRRR
jgi:membrane associated rhomboid family serine protease